MSLFDSDRAASPSEATDATEMESQLSSGIPANDFADGIYFNISEADYHAMPRLSASGIKNILVSLPTFWAASWMNTEESDSDDSTKAQILGSAYHVAIFEPETLDQRYVGEPDLSEYPGILMTDTEVKAELKDMGAPQTKAGEVAVERAARLQGLGYDGPIKSLIIDDFVDALEGRQQIGSKYWGQIMRDIERIRANPEILKLVTGGASEVTILWTCPDSGIPMKSRIDKLKSDRFVDLKSFANANGKPVEQAITDQVKYYKYYLSMRVYQTAIEMIGELDLKVMGHATDTEHGLADVLRAKSTPHQPWLFFQEKNGVPNLLARRLKLQAYPDGVEIQSIGAEDHNFNEHDSVLCRKADVEIRRAKQLFVQAHEVYGTDKTWYGFDMIGDIGDEDFNDYFLNEVPA